jgi:hypothetical protein
MLGHHKDYFIGTQLANDNYLGSGFELIGQSFYPIYSIVREQIKADSGLFIPTAWGT